MVIRSELPRFSEAEYLARERESDVKHEFIDGRIVAMAGVSRAHSLITVNLIGELRQALKGSDCETYDSDLRVRVAETGLYTYPDVTVACQGPEFEDDKGDTLLNPSVIFEVLSPGTEAYDRGEKFARYRRLPSLQAYVLVAQDRCRVEMFVRHGAMWLMSEVAEPDGLLRLDALDCVLPLSEIYDRLSFEGRDR